MYRVALLVDGTSVHEFFAELVDWADQQPDVEIVALLVQQLPKQPEGKLRRAWANIRKSGFSLWLSRFVFARVIQFEALIALRRLKDREQSRDIGAKVPLHIHIAPVVSKSGFVYRFADDDLERIRELRLDIIVRTGSGILKGGILSAAKHGVISPHHGDNRINRGGPPGFWEVFERQPYTGFVIQRLTEELDGGEVLFRGSMATEFTYTRNQKLLFERSAIPLQNTIRRVLDGRATPEIPHIYSDRLYTYPKLGETLSYVAKVARTWSKSLASRLLRRHARWSIAYLHGRWEDAVLRRGKVVPNPPGHFLADPFAVTGGDGTRYIFAEDYDYSEGKGSVAAYRLRPDGVPERLGIVLKEDFHLSFPFLFWHDGSLYMCPETAARRQIRLYRCVDFPMKWEHCEVLVDGINAVDTIIFPNGGGWGMLTSVDSAGGIGYWELHAYLSDNPLGGWVKLQDEPLFMDASRGRNGGLLRRGSTFFRVAQRPDFDFYGRSFSIYRIDRLDADGYEETKVQEVKPGFFKTAEGTHHMHHDDELVVYDFVRRERVR
jgi:hypothetical protein